MNSNIAGEIIGNHNHLLGRVDGVDGIKTGYTRASGFNLLTSVHRDGRSLVAVVMGGRTAAARDHMMEDLIAEHIAEASNHGHTATMIADNESPLPPVAPASARAAPQVLAVNAPAPRARPNEAESGQGDSDEEAESRVDAAPAAEAAPPSPRALRSQSLSRLRPRARRASQRRPSEPRKPRMPNMSRPRTPPSSAGSRDPKAAPRRKGSLRPRPPRRSMRMRARTGKKDRGGNPRRPHQRDP